MDICRSSSRFIVLSWRSNAVLSTFEHFRRRATVTLLTHGALANVQHFSGSRVGRRLPPRPRHALPPPIAQSISSGLRLLPRPDRRPGTAPRFILIIAARALGEFTHICSLHFAAACCASECSRSSAFRALGVPPTSRGPATSPHPTIAAGSPFSQPDDRRAASRRASLNRLFRDRSSAKAPRPGRARHGLREPHQQREAVSTRGVEPAPLVALTPCATAIMRSISFGPRCSPRSIAKPHGVTKIRPPFGRRVGRVVLFSEFFGPAKGRRGPAIRSRFWVHGIQKAGYAQTDHASPRRTATAASRRFE
jgi:hypothetical protein